MLCAKKFKVKCIKEIMKELKHVLNNLILLPFCYPFYQIVCNITQQAQFEHERFIQHGMHSYL